MQGRVNTRLLTILAITTVVLVGGLAGIYYGFVHKSTDERIALAEEYRQAGDIERAVRELQNALHRDQGNVDLVIRLYDTMQEQQVSAGVRARKVYLDMTRLIQAASVQAPENPRIFQRRVDFLMQWARRLGDPSAWNEIYRVADTTLGVNADMLVAHKYRGMAQVNRLEGGVDPGEAGRLVAKQDLETFLQTPGNEEDADVNFHLAVWHVLESRQPRQRQNQEALRAEAERITNELRQRHPARMDLQINHARVLLMLEKKAEAKQIVAELEKQTLESPGAREDIASLTMLVAATEVPELGRELTSDQARAIRQRQRQLLAVAVEKYPDDMSVRVQNAMMFDGTDPQAVQAALQTFAQIRQTPVRASPIEAFMQTHFQRVATKMEAGLQLQLTAPLPTNDPRRAAGLKQVGSLLEEIADESGEDAHYRLLAGKLALFEARYSDAVIHLSEANKSFLDTNAELLLALAQSLRAINQPGGAQTHLNNILKIKGLRDYTQIRWMLADIAIEVRQYGEAELQMEEIAKINPQEPRLQDLRMKLANARGDTQAAIQVARDSGGARAVLIEAQLLLGNEQHEEGLALLDRHFREHPGDLEALQLLLMFDPEQDQQLEYLRLAQGAGVQNEMIDQLAQVLEGNLSTEAFMERRIQANPDPAERALARYSLLTQAGKTTEAQEQLRLAEQAAPDDPRVVNALFNVALAESRWQRAQTLAARARTLNLDKVEGLIYLGRIEMARQRYDRAVPFFADAVKRFATAEHWQLLGDAQREAPDLIGAINSYNESLKLRPGNMAALHGLALTYDRRGEHGRALEELGRAYEHARRNPQIRRMYVGYMQLHGDKEKALALRQEMAASEPKDYDNRRSLVLLLGDLKRFDEALSSLDGLFTEEGRTLANVTTLAQLRNIQGDPVAAQQVLEEHVLGLGDQATVTDWLMLARFRFELNLAEASLQAYQQAQTLEDPTARPASRELADRLFDLGAFDPSKYALANQLYGELVAGSAEDVALLQRYTDSLLAAGDPGKASEVLAQIVKAKGGVEDDKTLWLGAKIAWQQQDTARALRALEQAARLAPQQPLIPMLQAQILFGMPGQEGPALEATDKALQLNPNLIPARLLRANLRMRNNETDVAITELRGILAVEPNNRDARLLLANVYLGTQRNSDARRVLAESIVLFPSEPIWRIQLARLARSEGRMSEAADLLSEVFKINPHPDLLAEYAVGLVEAKRAAEAVAVMRQHGAMLEQYPVLHAYLGVALANDGKLDDARAALRTAIEGVNNMQEMRIVAAQASSGLGRSRAPALLEECITPRNRLWVNLQLSDWEVTDHRFDAAVQRLGQLDSALAADAPERPDADRLYSLALHQTNDFAKARQVYERMLKRNDRDIITLNNLAYLVSEEMNDPRQALTYAEKAYELFPENDDILDTLGWIQFRVGQKPQALSSLRRSVALRKTKSNCMHLAKVLIDDGGSAARDEARQLLNDAKRIAERTRDAQLLTEVNALLSQVESLSHRTERETQP